ncbi:MAG: HipA family kinase [Polyangiaceae bacterium]
MRTVTATRYVLPMKQGGSVPALVEADDLGLYIVKLRGAAQGKKALVAELVAGEIGRALGLRVPELVLVDVDRALSQSEPDPEIAEPLEKSAGGNLGLDYLPGSVTFDPLAGPPADAATASLVVLFDAFTMNVDRTPRNTNILLWHRQHWLIDHGAALYVHHGWPEGHPLASSADTFPEIAQHVLLPRTEEIDAAAAVLEARLDAALLSRIVADLPDDWLGEAGQAPAEDRDLYRRWLEARMTHLPALVAEVKRARA